MINREDEPKVTICEPDRAFERLMIIENYKALTAEYGRRINIELGLDEVDPQMDELRMETFLETLDDSESLVLVAKLESDRIVGFLAGDVWEEKNEFVKPPYIEVFELMIDKDWQGKGIGSKLLDAAEDWCKRHGIGNMTLTAQEFNVGAIKLYERKGYKTIHRLMQKRLGDLE